MSSNQSQEVEVDESMLSTRRLHHAEGKEAHHHRSLFRRIVGALKTRSTSCSGRRNKHGDSSPATSPETSGSNRWDELELEDNDELFFRDLNRCSMEGLEDLRRKRAESSPIVCQEEDEDLAHSLMGHAFVTNSLTVTHFKLPLTSAMDVDGALTRC